MNYSRNIYIGNVYFRFAQFFIAPIFTQSAIKAQIIKTMFQHNQNINSDSRRIGHMIKNGADPNHPLYQNYITGI